MLRPELLLISAGPGVFLAHAGNFFTPRKHDAVSSLVRKWYISYAYSGTDQFGSMLVKLLRAVFLGLYNRFTVGNFH